MQFISIKKIVIYYLEKSIILVLEAKKARNTD